METTPSLQQRVDTLEQELNRALERIERLEKGLRDEDYKMQALQRELKKEHDLIGRLEHGIPVGL